MAKFILHGVIVEEPIKKTTTKGKDVITVKVEERYATSFGEKVNVYDVNFFGKATTCIPACTKLRGSLCICLGQVTSSVYRDKLYYDLSGEQFTLIAPQPFEEGAPKVTPTQAQEPEIEIPQDDDDDLPF